MPGAHKFAVDLQNVEWFSLDRRGQDREEVKPTPTILDLLKKYRVVKICSEGSIEHSKEGLAKEKVLVKAYDLRSTPRPEPRRSKARTNYFSYLKKYREKPLVKA